jgi:L-seryl-tRNA(Ser) seleniumtransferase
MHAVAGYSTLEYDVDAGTRGSRQGHTHALLCELTGAEDALVATNAAAALFLLVNTLADAGESIVSRGELVEIGGSFRIPEILRRSGTVLIEVGTTNRTRIRDYVLAISPRTRLILKVHRSNFEMQGFVAEATLAELVELARERGITVVHDVGSGLLLSLDEYGLSGEPLVRDSVQAGAVVVFSGDKLLGGPQAGIVVGPAAVVERAAKNPLARALRPDKLTVAALEATLRLYRDPTVAISTVPVLSMLTVSPDVLRERAAHLAALLPGSTMRPGASAVGGGSFPQARLPTTLVCITPDDCDALVAGLRRHAPPVIARVEGGQVVFDPRTMANDELEIVAVAVREIEA